MKIMYIRTSTEGQNTERQEVMAKEHGIEKVFIDKASGKNTDRPAFQEMINFAREGDIVYSESISRMSRNTKDFLETMSLLKQKKVQFISLKENIDTNTPTGQFLLTVLAAMSELERESILQRQKEGIAVARAKGVYKGRAPMSYDKEKFKSMVYEWSNKQRTASSIMKEFNITGTTFYRWIKEYGYTVTSNK